MEEEVNPIKVTITIIRVIYEFMTIRLQVNLTN